MVTMSRHPVVDYFDLVAALRFDLGLGETTAEYVRRWAIHNAIAPGTALRLVESALCAGIRQDQHNELVGYLHDITVWSGAPQRAVPAGGAVQHRAHGPAVWWHRWSTPVKVGAAAGLVATVGSAIGWMLWRWIT